LPMNRSMLVSAAWLHWHFDRAIPLSKARLRKFPWCSMLRDTSTTGTLQQAMEVSMAASPSAPPQGQVLLSWTGIPTGRSHFQGNCSEIFAQHANGHKHQMCPPDGHGNMDRRFGNMNGRKPIHTSMKVSAALSDWHSCRVI
jgi:hypothetical protein